MINDVVETMNEITSTIPRKSSRASLKSQTRTALIQASIELFTELGYANTTLEAVAERANLHVQTLYRHFPSKELLAVAPERDNLEKFKTDVRLRDPEQPFTSFWREWVARSAGESQTRNRELLLRRIRGYIIPAVAGQGHEIMNEFLDLLENSLADEFHLDPRTSRYPRLFAAMLWEGNNYASHRWASNHGRSDLVQEVTEVIDDVCRLMQLWNSANTLAVGSKESDPR